MFHQQNHYIYIHIYTHRYIYIFIYIFIVKKCLSIEMIRNECSDLLGKNTDSWNLVNSTSRSGNIWLLMSHCGSDFGWRWWPFQQWLPSRNHMVRGNFFQMDRVCWDKTWYRWRFFVCQTERYAFFLWEFLENAPKFKPLNEPKLAHASNWNIGYMIYMYILHIDICLILFVSRWVTSPKCDTIGRDGQQICVKMLCVISFLIFRISILH